MTITGDMTFSFEHGSSKTDPSHLFHLLQNFHLIDFNVLTLATIVLARRLIAAIVREVSLQKKPQWKSFVFLYFVSFLTIPYLLIL